MAEEYEEPIEDAIPVEEEDEEGRSEEIAREVGKLVEKIEKEMPAEEEEEVTEYGVVIYRVESDLLAAMLLQSRLYEEAVEGRISPSEAKARVEKELAPVIQRLEQDIKKSKKKEKKKKKTKKRKS